MRVDVFAPAKINLALHITGQRGDGYHLLDTLVAFADIGDTVTLRGHGPLGLEVSGPEAAPELSGNSNIMWATAAKFWTPDRPLSMHLEKCLPVASGIGGGSADAAATYRGLLVLRAALEGQEMPRDVTPDDLLALMQIGADVPMCVLSDPARVRGIGEKVEPVANFPALPVVLVNPRVQVSTPAVFSALARKDNAGMDTLPDGFSDREALLEWLGAQRNDLQAPAIADCPVVSDCLRVLGQTAQCRLARMSGSGATCFGLFDDDADARAAAQAIEQAHPEWWVRAGRLNGGAQAAPQLIRSTT